jgi:hypothetical protein
MKVILRNTVNNLYVVDHAHWTHEQAKAHDFERADRALEAARSFGLQNLELMISLNGIHFDISKPLAH